MSIFLLHKRQPTIAPALIILFLLRGLASGGEKPCRTNSPFPRNSGKIYLQLRIEEAKRRTEGIRYYRSVARQQKYGKEHSPPAGRDMPP
jgi:hypothetical protein